MAFNFKAPNVVSTLPTPRIQVPESGRSHAVEAGIAGFLSSAKDVAESYRDHQEAVLQAKNLANFYEQQGMTQEAELYRKSADTFRVNFFKDPKSANAGRSAILNDALSALKVSQDRKNQEALMSIREKELESLSTYRKGMVDAAKTNASDDAAERKQDIGRGDAYLDSGAGDFTEAERKALRGAGLKAILSIRKVDTSERNAETSAGNLGVRKEVAAADIAYKQAKAKEIAAKTDEFIKTGEARGKLLDARINYTQDQIDKLNRELSSAVGRSGVKSGMRVMLTAKDGVPEYSISGDPNRHTPEEFQSVLDMIMNLSSEVSKASPSQDLTE